MGNRGSKTPIIWKLNILDWSVKEQRVDGSSILFS